jgi:hypothetical protein
MPQTEGTSMNNIAQTRKLSAVSVPFAIPTLLAVNTLALLALEQLGGIPGWVKSAVALFLSF